MTEDTKMDNQYLIWLKSLMTEELAYMDHKDMLAVEYTQILKSFLETNLGDNQLVELWRTGQYSIENAAVFLDSLYLLKNMLEIPILTYFSKKKGSNNGKIVQAKVYLPEFNGRKRKQLSLYLGFINEAEESHSFSKKLAQLTEEKKVRKAMVEKAFKYFLKI